ncbi:hypothetical protein POTOM_040812 [Populus tomentosa]|uniref:Uncharacterized protein n=1 Tax=Populus tomentosa TaxID=118781 RepID=A0A8X8CHP2_POPTO|nr:hypothetical protein POTOM_040812 [Populus tomentosa]
MEMNQLQLQIQGLTQMVKRADRDGNHVKRCNRYVSLVVDIDFNAIGDKNDDVASWGYRDQIWQLRNNSFYRVKRVGKFV